MNSFIETWNQWGGQFLSFAWPMFWQSSLLIAGLFTVDLLYRRKLRASIRYALWLVVLVKLCVPPTLALPTSPAWWLHKTPPPVVVKSLPHYTVTYDNGPLPEIPQTLLAAIVPPKPVMTNAAWLLVVSTVVSSALLLWLLVRWWQITRLVCRAATAEQFSKLLGEALCLAGAPVSDPACSSSFLKRAGSETGAPDAWQTSVRLKLVEGPMSPAVCGLLRPVILLPRSLAERLSADQLRAVLLHELIHLRRRDVWMNFLQALLQIVYWWHPLVWLANARIRRVREEAVDDAVMLALRDEAEAYAPTLLEVAKLALNRPLASLGLVGIMESRHALRQRIERLVDFHPPRQAGLTLVSLLGILAFTAIAVPMGQAPASSSDATGLQSLTVKVNPEVFLRNVKAQAANYMHETNDDWVPILTDILSSEGVDDVSPHTFEFKIKTGEMTANNSPEALEVFRQILEQLNREDGKGRPFVPNSSYHRSFHPTSVLIKAQFYAMRTADFRKLIGYADNVSFDPGNYKAAPIAAERFAEFSQIIKSLGLSPFSSPRVQTGHGILAEFYTGVGTNGVHFDCQPYISAKGIELAFRADVIGNLSADGTTLVGSANHTFNGRVLAQDHDGVIVCANNYDGSVKNNLVVVLEVQIVTNAVPVKANARTIEKINAAGQLVQGAKQDYEMGKMDDAERLLKFALEMDSDNAAAKYYLELVQSARKDPKPEIIKPARPVIAEKLDRIRFDQFGPIDGMSLSEVMDKLVTASGIAMSIEDSSIVNVPINLPWPLYNVSLPRALDAVVQYAGKPINYFIVNGQVAFSIKDQPPVLFMRAFAVNSNLFPAALRNSTGMQTSSVPAMARSMFNKLGVDWELPKGKTVFYEDRLGMLFVKATASDLEVIEHAISALNQIAPQIHIKARFLEAPKGTLDGLKNIVSITNQFATSNQGAGLIGILTDENFRTMLRDLEARPGVEALGEPEVVTTSGRQTQMRATTKVDIIYDHVFTNIVPLPLEIGAVLDVVPYVLSDGYTINLTLIPSLTELLVSSNSMPKSLPVFRMRQVVTTLNLWDNQTAIISGLPETDYVNGKEVADKSKASNKELLVFITATIVDPAGNRVHSDDELPFAQNGIPPQPQPTK